MGTLDFSKKMTTRRFRAPQEFDLIHQNPAGKDFIIGLDVGYGGTKLFFEGGHICFPSYAKLLNNNVLISDPNDILYKDLETNETYIVGYNAQEMITSADTNDTDTELFSRKRYSDTRFRIICNTALGLAARKKNSDEDSRNIIIQSSLPASYIDADSMQFRKALANNSPFALKVGDDDWQEFHFDLTIDNINNPIPQPMAALYSTITRNDGNMVKSMNPKDPDAKRLLTGGTLVIDAGFETLDLYGTQSRRRICNDSIDDMGMRTIFDVARKKILDDTGEDIRVSEMQKYLTSGEFTVVDEETMKSTIKSISPYIEEANKAVVEKAKKKIQSATNSLRGYENVIISGGTGATWFDELRGWLSNMQIHIYPSDINDNFGMYFSIARGDYMYCYALEKGR